MHPISMDLPEESLREFLERHVGKLRLLAFREDDRNNRRLLFDSESVSGDSGEGQQSSHAQPDAKLVAEMIFGSTPTVCNGESLKIHQFRTPSRLMFTKLFPAHQLSTSASVQRCQNSVQRRFSMDPDFMASGSKSDTPQLTASKFSSSELFVQRMVSSDCSRRSSESSEDCEILPALHRLRRQRIGLAVLFTVGEESQTENDPIVKRRIRFLCSQSPSILAAIRDELQDVVLTAYCARTSVAETMKRAWQRYLLSLRSLCESTCRAHYLLRYFKISWTASSNGNDELVKRFMDTLSAFGTKCETKQNNFFLSTLVTAVLGMERNAASNSGKQVTELRIKTNNSGVLTQILEIIGYFLKFVVADFDRISIRPVPIPLMRSLSSRITSKPSGPFASLLNLVRTRNIRERPIDESASALVDRRGSISSSRSSPVSNRTVPAIVVKENGFDDDSMADKEAGEHSSSSSSSANSIASSANMASSTSGVQDDQELLAMVFENVEEKPFSVHSSASNGMLMNGGRDALTPLCGDLDASHHFDDDVISSRSLDMVISLIDSATTSHGEIRQESLIIDATTWKIYQTYMDDSTSQNADNTCCVCFPSSLVTELLENVRMLRDQGCDAKLCFMYMEDELKTLFSKADAIVQLTDTSRDISELRSDFCAKIYQHDIVDLSFLLK